MTAAFGQTPTAAPKNSVITGDVVSISAGKIVLQTKDGEVNVTLSEKTEYKRVSPDNPSLKAAVAAAFAEIGNGDKLMVTGLMSDDQKTLPAKSVYLMTKSDIAQKQAKDKERWSARGISGRIVTVNPNTNTKPANPNRITAIRLLAGVEPFIRAAQATSSGQRGHRVQSLNIPGLDGFDIP